MSEAELKGDDILHVEPRSTRISSSSTPLSPPPSTDMFDPLSPSFISITRLDSSTATAFGGRSHTADSPASPRSPSLDSQSAPTAADWGDLAFHPEPPRIASPASSASSTSSTSSFSTSAPPGRPTRPPSLPKSVPTPLAGHLRTSSAVVSPTSRSPQPPSTKHLTPAASKSPSPPVVGSSSGGGVTRPSSPSVPPVMTTSFSVPIPSSPLSSGSGSGQSTGIGQRRSSASAIITTAPASNSTAASPTLIPTAPAMAAPASGMAPLVISSPLPLPLSAVLSASSSSHPPSFAAHLLHKPGVILTSIRSTLHIVDSLRHYFKHHAALQLSIARQLHDHTSAEYGRVHAGSSSGVLSALLSYYDKMNAVGQAYGQLGQEVTERCCVPLSRCAENGKNMVEVSEKEWKKLQHAMEQATHALHKEKDAAKVAVHSLSREREREREAARSEAGDPSIPSSAASASQLSSSLKSAFSQLQRRVVTGAPAGGAADGSGRHQLALDSARRKAIRCCEAYQKALEQSNSLQQRTWKQLLPALIKDLQAQQEMNLTTLTNALHTFTHLTDAFHSRLVALNADVTHTLGTVSVESDIRHFVDQTVDEFGLPVLPEPLKYDLPVTAASLRKEEESTTLLTTGSGAATGSSTVFKNTLEGCLRHDRQSSPPSGPLFGVVSRAGVLDVPMIVPYLIVSIIHQGGLDSEGIFRLSASSDTVAATRARLEAHDYSVLEGLDSPHTAAAVLKGFLRDLTEPLIPTALYERSIEMGKGLMMGEKGEDKRVELSDILASVPLLHRRVLFHLLSFLSVIASPAHSSINRMTRANLSIVFTPSLLRSSSLDPSLMLAESKFATQFVLWLMDRFEEGGKEGDWKEEWEWSGREEAGCGGYPWIEQQQPAVSRRKDSVGSEVDGGGKEREGGAGKEEEQGGEKEEKGDGGGVLPAGAEVTGGVGGDLPSGWQCVVDSKSGLPFYFHSGSHEVTWVKPVT